VIPMMSCWTKYSMRPIRSRQLLSTLSARPGSPNPAQRQHFLVL